MKIEVKSLEKKIAEREVLVYTLKNSKNTEVNIINYGGIILSILTEDKYGNLADIALGYEDIEDYTVSTPYFGAIIGRFSNRIENSEISINGKEYKLAKNDGNNHLHGGNVGYNKVFWESKIRLDDNNTEYLELKYLSIDGEENYPGNLNITVNYKLTDENELVMEYYGKSDQDTIVNLTNHSYFNLAGHNSGSILEHELIINSDKITENNDEGICTGKILDVDDTPMSFRKFTSIGNSIDSNYYQIQYAKGYDHNWILRGRDGEYKKAAEVREYTSGRVMEVYTTKPGVQFYSGNYLNGNDKGKGGNIYMKRAGFCLETQYFPNSLKCSNFPNVILKKGEEYYHKTSYVFSIL